MGYPAMSFTGRQAGIETNGTHNKAKIVKVHNERILAALEAGKIPVVAGFQGIDANDDITTLGRGGSDTTAVAVAWGIGADICEIYSDVDGVYTTDPRVAPRARKLNSVSYDDMLELSSAGSGVLQSRAVEFAKKWGVVIHSRSAFSDAEGTYIKENPDMEEAVITGIAHDTSEMKVTIRRIPDTTGVAARVFSALSANMVNLDMIIQNTSTDGLADISFTCPAADLARAKETLDQVLPEIGASNYDVDEDIAKISIVGTGMKSSPGVSAKAFRTLGENNINIIAISTSPIRLSMVIDAAETAHAVQVLHTAFGLDSDSVFVETQLSAEEIAAKMQKGR
jgi:aspartate kinase